ncbi:type II toxin-antitoxin system PemK/MazF family toxin [Persicitalea sp.]|uniref:type II toxin-antitoxin system PemK/MazF family toxin n=1 Tax=Persicitalea sp. TaxID=3100273 RepID=UPI003592F998
MELKQYSVVLVNLEPTVGSEIRKTRPCVIVSPNEMNRHLNTIVVAPMTTNLKEYRFRVLVKQNNTQGMVAMDQIRTVDRSRVLRVFDKLSKVEIENCKDVLKQMLVD